MENFWFRNTRAVHVRRAHAGRIKRGMKNKKAPTALRQMGLFLYN
jgi:hypothetical protein